MALLSVTLMSRGNEEDSLFVIQSGHTFLLVWKHDTLSSLHVLIRIEGRPPGVQTCIASDLKLDGTILKPMTSECY